MRHFPKERGRPLKGAGEWDVMGLPFQPINVPILPKVYKRKHKPDLTLCKRIPPKGTEVIWIKGKNWKYKHREDAKRFASIHVRESNAKRKVQLAMYHKDWHSSTKNLPPLPHLREEANSRDRYDAGPSLRRCVCGVMFQGYGFSRCVKCSIGRTYSESSKDQENLWGDLGFGNFGWVTTERLLGMFNVGLVGIDIIVEKYIQPPDKDNPGDIDP